MALSKFKQIKDVRINLDSDKWGRQGWDFLYASAIGYPLNPTEEEKNDAMKLLISLRTMLSCNKCRKNYSNHEKKIDDNIVSSRVNLFMWLVDTENEVRKSMGKKIYTYDERFNHYYKLFMDDTKYDEYILFGTIGLGIFLLWLLFKE